MKPITIRLDADVLDKIEELKGAEQRTDFIRNLIVSNLSSKESQSIHEESQKNLQELNDLKKQIAYSEIRVSDLLAQIESQKNQMKTLEQQLGFLQLEYQKLTDRLMLPAAKSWWQFWKK